jgi:hypothetical protein
MKHPFRSVHALARRLSIATVLAALPACASNATPESFKTPEEAMRAIVSAAESHDGAAADKLLGAGGADLLRSGDDVADREDLEWVKEAMHEKLAFEDSGAGTKIALLGNDGWPFPIPLVAHGDAWQFDAVNGAEEITNRRIGRNELHVIATMHAYVDAQNEYHSEGRDNQPLAFATKVISSPGKHDGLYWPTAEGEPDSPLGPLVADATEEGYTTDEGPRPYHGYFYRTLTSQGPHAPGGEKSYITNGAMTRGFALLAWPAKYGNSGVMTFEVSRTGLVYQKDLGENTENAVRAIINFDPDESWAPTAD